MNCAPQLCVLLWSFCREPGLLETNNNMYFVNNNSTTSDRLYARRRKENRIQLTTTLSPHTNSKVGYLCLPRSHRHKQQINDKHHSNVTATAAIMTRVDLLRCGLAPEALCSHCRMGLSAQEMHPSRLVLRACYLLRIRWNCFCPFPCSSSSYG
jgi:hypothetical protein